jgi:hypothetical protein
MRANPYNGLALLFIYTNCCGCIPEYKNHQPLYYLVFKVINNILWLPKVHKKKTSISIEIDV